MTRNEIFRRRLGRQIHDHDVGRCVGFDIIMQQIFTRLRCKDAADKTVVLLNLSCMRLENTSLSSTHGGSARSQKKRHRQRSSLQVATCRRTDQLRPAIVADGVAQHDPQKKSNARSCCRDKAWFSSTLSSSRGTPMRVFFVPILRFTRFFVLRSHLVRSKIDDT